MRSRRALLLVLAAGGFAAAVAAGLILTSHPKMAKAGTAFVDTVPTSLPTQGVRLDAGPKLLLMPTDVEPSSLGVTSAVAAIAEAPDNDIPKAARAVLATVTAGDGIDIVNRLAWVVTYDYEKPHEVPFMGQAFGRPDPPAVYAHGQVTVIDAKTGEFLLGFYLMNKFSPSPSAQTPESKSSPSPGVIAGSTP